MVLILLSWLYIFFTSIAVGIGFSKLFRIQTASIVIDSVLGLFGVTLLAGIWAIFGPINILFHAFLLVIVLWSLFAFREDFTNTLQNTKTQFLALPKNLRSLFVFSCLLALAQSTTFPFVIDNETYYVQTIKWLNEYGFVPGLANLHLFLGQTSGWHITQSVYSLSFIFSNLNDINGYCFLLLSFWSFGKLHAYFTTNNRLDLVFGLLPLSYIFLFQFINAPSPDFAVYFLAFLAFDLYLQNEKPFSVDAFKTIAILILFAIFIKITAIVLWLLPLIIVIKNYSVLRSKIIGLRLLIGLVFILWVCKNIILTGYPLYPSTVSPLPGADFAVPKEVMDYFFSKSMMHSFYLPFGSYEKAGFLDIAKTYFLYGGIDSLIGISTLVLAFIAPVIFWKFYKSKALWQLYLAFITLLILLSISSPQYRFYVYFTLFFGLVLAAVVITNHRIVVALVSLSLLITAIPVFMPVSFKELTDNSAMANNDSFALENIITPKPNSKISGSLATSEKGNLKYYTPIVNPTPFWITGNISLPCANESQLGYFETNFHILPQQRGKDLSQGFYAKKVKPNE